MEDVTVCVYCDGHTLSGSDELVEIGGVLHSCYRLVPSRTLCNLTVSSLNFTRQTREEVEAVT